MANLIFKLFYNNTSLEIRKRNIASLWNFSYKIKEIICKRNVIINNQIRIKQNKKWVVKMSFKISFNIDVWILIY